MYVLTADNMKKAEEKANKGGLSYFTMMERAGNACGDVIAGRDKNSKVVILCGKGKNGGDGLVIAARLWQHGFRNVFVVLVHGGITDTLCLEMYAEMVKYPVIISDYIKDKATADYHISTADVIVDSVFGIGFKGELADSSADAVSVANGNSNAYKYAVDIPSGLSADGSYNGALFFNTDETLSMIAFKPVHIIKPAADFCGKTTVIDIGIDNEYVSEFAENYTALTADEAFQNIKKRGYNDHKGTYGKVLTICGSRNMPGCVYLCNQAAVEIGAGLVTSAFPDCIYEAVTPKMNEPVLLPLEYNDSGRISRLACKKLLDKIKESSVVAVGCGLGVDRDTIQIVEFVIENCECPLVLDADALNCVSKNTDILKNAKCDIIVTPHPGEMARLTNKSIAEIEQNRVAVAKEFAANYGVTVLLKGANTVVADKNGRLAINTTGNPSMARGGSGDVLTGIIAGLVPQTADTFSAVCTGAYIHGATGDYVVRKYGSLAATPTRVVEHISAI